MASSDYDWRSEKMRRGWPYKKDAPWDEQWLKDRAELFSNTGNELAPFNGWWWLTTNHVHKPLNKTKIIFPKKYRKKK